jgi:integrase
MSPVLRFARGHALTHEQRSALLRRFAAGDGTPLDRRVAACLVLLHGLPLSRILRLRAGDVTRGQDDQVCLRIGDPPVPEPFAGLLAGLASTRPAGSWLFPGRQPGQLPVEPGRSRYCVTFLTARSASYRLIRQARPGQR